MFQRGKQRERADESDICTVCAKEPHCDVKPDYGWRHVLVYCQRFEGADNRETTSTDQRHSKRVSSETGVAITAVTEPRRATYQERLDIIRKVLQKSPPTERRAMIADIVREELEG